MTLKELRKTLKERSLTTETTKTSSKIEDMNKEYVENAQFLDALNENITKRIREREVEKW